ncbi:hypothetical protein [Geobacter sp.]|uniref:hypothetical protein n=1 Tax=Geobacter sp. TaxID=46610 RepID=UPI00262E9EE1|nr:hypothetical protein [Geobacter sp.]
MPTFLVRAHTMQDAVNAALARRAEAQGNFYATNTHRMLAELDREERGQPAPSPVRRENRTIRKGEK